MLLSTKKKITEFPSEDQSVKDSVWEKITNLFFIEMSLDNLPDMKGIWTD